jgi:hypothetical protein
MLCQTRIVLGDEYPVMGYLTEQRQMRHEAYTLTARLVLGISQWQHIQEQAFLACSTIKMIRI